MQTNQLLKEQNNTHHLTKEVAEILEILDQIETRTADLRKKLMSELKTSENTVHIKLDAI